MAFELLITVVVLLLTAYFTFFRGSKDKSNPKAADTKETVAESNTTKNAPTVSEATNDTKGRVEMRIVYGSTTGTAKKFSELLHSNLPKEALLKHANPSKQNSVNPMVSLDVPKPDSADGVDPWDMLESSDAADEFLGETSLVHVVILSTWTGGVAPMLASRWYDGFIDMSNDFRVGTSAMNGVRFAVYGLGSSEYDENWCTAAKDVYDGFLRMGATPLVPFGKGDDTTDMTEHFNEWLSDLTQALTNQDKAMKNATIQDGKTNSSSSSSECCGGSGQDEDCGCGTPTTASEATSGGKKKKGPKVIKGVAKPKKTKEERRQNAAAKGSATAAAMTDDALASPEDEENDRLLRDADLEDTDEDSDLEEDAKKSNKKGSAAKKKKSSAVVSSAELTSSSGSSSSVVDLEDMGDEIGKAARESAKNELKEALVDDSAELEDDELEDEEEEEEEGGGCGVVSDVRPEMVTPLQRKALTKEGYKIIGTHSAVKLCRWTKHQLRGRGGCYKHTMYGITSYQCMEATPSLACANKCVFCWRHHKNPVGREWRWKEDEPEDIVKEAIHLHTRMVNEFKGAKGVHADRIAEAMTVRHCALSLVGEPIMYPRINELVSELHKRNISTFLVTNAQFPEEIRNLVPVTQLYVSIDAATKESLKAVDRPLFKDFWERFLGCLEELKKKGQRTVYRLTLVKSWNMEEVDQYVELLLIGEPDLVEIKAVTFCGTSDASSLTMENVPWHHEVVTFAKAIESHPKIREKYGLAAIHAHSCCTLLAKREVFFSSPNDQEPPRWRTWIDYPKFHELEEEYRKNGTPFSSKDYLADTPAWALPDAEEEGFDPIECRVRRNRKGEVVPIDYKSSESGCG